MNRNVEIIYNPPILNPNSIYNNFCNKPYKQTYQIQYKQSYQIPIKYNKSYDPLLDPVLNKQLNPLLNPRFNSNNKKPLVLNIPKYKQINPISFIFNKM